MRRAGPDRLAEKKTSSGFWNFAAADANQASKAFLPRSEF